MNSSSKSRSFKIERVKLIDVAVNVVDGPFGSNLKTCDYVADGIPVLQGKNITNNKFNWTEIRYVTEQKAESLKRSKALLGDHLMIKIGSIGYSAILDNLNGYPFAIIPANMAKITPNIEVVDTRYLHHWLTSIDVVRYFKKAASKTAQPALSLKKIKELPIPLPPLPDQKRIAAILDKADALREKRRQAIAKLDKLLQSVFLDMFGDPVTNPKRWNMVNLPDLATHFCDGPFGSNLKTEHYCDSGVRVIRLQNIGVGDFLDIAKAFIAEEHFNSLPRNHCKPGDVLIGTLGDPNLRACILPKTVGRALNKADCILLRPNPSVATSSYICWLINSPSISTRAAGLALGQTRLRISMGRLKRLDVPLAPLALQKKFSNIVEKINIVKARKIMSLKVIENFFSSLQHRAFKGEL